MALKKVTEKYQLPLFERLNQIPSTLFLSL